MPFLSSSYVQKLLASDRANSDQFGGNIALSQNGGVAVISATASGNAYIFTFDSGVWTERAIIPSTGIALGISSDGGVVVVGSSSNSVIVYERTGQYSWTQKQILQQNFAGFGKGIAVSPSGNSILITATGTPHPMFPQQLQGGGAYLYERFNNSFVFSERFLQNLGFDGFILSLSPGEAVGAPVFIGDGQFLIGQYGYIYFGLDAGYVNETVELPAGISTLLTGDRGAAFAYFNNRSGNFGIEKAVLVLSHLTGSASTNAVYAYSYSSPSQGNGGRWNLVQKITSSDLADGDVFGGTVAVSSVEGVDTIVVGAASESTSPNSSNGAAYVFTGLGNEVSDFPGLSTWTQQQKILASDRADNDQHGIGVGISGDGLKLLVGANAEDTSPNTNQGAVYAYFVDQLPSQPIITSIENGATQVVVNFTPPASNAPFITNYQFSLNNGSTFTALNPVDITSPITLTGLTSGVPCVVVIRAINSSGNAGLSSNNVLAFPGRPTAPRITTIDIGNAQLAVGFTAPSFTGGSAITNYQYSIATNTVVISSATVSSNIATITTASDHGMSVGDTASIFNLTVNSNIEDFIVISAPTSTTFTVIYIASNGSITLGSSPTATDAVFETLDPANTTSPITITGLSNEVTYNVSIRAVNANGFGASSLSLSATPSSVPSAPNIFEIIPSNQTLDVQFNAPSYNGGSPITNYEFSINGGATFTPLDPADSTSPVSISGLINGVNYAVSIRAFNDFSVGAASDVVIGTPSTTPDAPTISDITPSNKELIVSIIPPIFNGGSFISNFEYSIDGGITFVSTLGNPIKIRELVNKVSYSVIVRAVNPIGAGQPSVAVLGTPNSVDRALNAFNKALAPIHAEQDRYNFGPKLEGDIRILLEDQNNYLTFNNLDDDGIIWVISDIDGWWNLPEPSMPDVERGFGDGSFDVTGRNLARIITLTGSVLFTDSSRANIASKSAYARKQLLSAFNLVKRGTWFIVDEDEYKRAAFVRLSGRPNITTVNNRGRIEFSIGLRAADPIKYEWLDGTSSNFPVGQPVIANGYNLATIGQFGDTTQETYSKYGNTDLNPSTLENYRDYNLYGDADINPDTNEDYRQYKITTSQTGISGAVTVENYGDSIVYCLFRIIGPFFGPAEILNTTTGQKISINSPVSPSTQILLPTADTDSIVEFLDINTRLREVQKGDFTNGEQEGSSRGLLDPIVDWIYLEPGKNTIVLNDYGTDAVTATPKLEIYWRSGWLG